MIDTQSGAESMLSSGENINFYNLLRKDRFAFLLDDAVSSQTDFRLIILNEDTQQTSEVRFRYKIPKNTYIRLIGLNVYQGQRYWIAQTSSEILRLWEDGRVENFPLSSNYHKIRYFMGLLFSYE